MKPLTNNSNKLPLNAEDFSRQNVYQTALAK